jgi:NAD(P)-dependent dehydrogenase (short-subunit alcohol dehydrogenase family)
MPFNNPRVALVTGGAKGIGLAIVEMLVGEGVRVIVLDKAGMTKTDHSDLIDFRKCDLSSKEDLEKTVRSLQERYPTLDYLVNNAAIQYVESLEKMDFSHWDQVFAVNLKAPAFLIQSFSPRMKPGSQIVNISSIHSRVPRMDKYAYDFSKAGLDLLTKEMALALADRKIRVNSISIGAADTPMNDGFADRRVLEETIAKIPLKTIIQPQEVARLARYILMETETATGSVFTIDGGRSL